MSSVFYMFPSFSSLPTNFGNSVLTFLTKIRPECGDLYDATIGWNILTVRMKPAMRQPIPLFHSALRTASSFPPWKWPYIFRLCIYIIYSVSQRIISIYIYVEYIYICHKFFHPLWWLVSYSLHPCAWIRPSLHSPVHLQRQLPGGQDLHWANCENDTLHKVNRDIKKNIKKKHHLYF